MACLQKLKIRMVSDIYKQSLTNGVEKHLFRQGLIEKKNIYTL